MCERDTTASVRSKNYNFSNSDQKSKMWSEGGRRPVYSSSDSDSEGEQHVRVSEGAYGHTVSARRKKRAKALLEKYRSQCWDKAPSNRPLTRRFARGNQIEVPEITTPPVLPSVGHNRTQDIRANKVHEDQIPNREVLQPEETRNNARCPAAQNDATGAMDALTLEREYWKRELRAERERACQVQEKLRKDFERRLNLLEDRLKSKCNEGREESNMSSTHTREYGNRNECRPPQRKAQFYYMKLAQLKPFTGLASLNPERFVKQFNNTLSGCDFSELEKIEAFQGLIRVESNAWQAGLDECTNSLVDYQNAFVRAFFAEEMQAIVKAEFDATRLKQFDLVEAVKFLDLWYERLSALTVYKWTTRDIIKLLTEKLPEKLRYPLIVHNYHDFGQFKAAAIAMIQMANKTWSQGSNKKQYDRHGQSEKPMVSTYSLNNEHAYEVERKQVGQKDRGSQNSRYEEREKTQGSYEAPKSKFNNKSKWKDNKNNPNSERSKDRRWYDPERDDRRQPRQESSGNAQPPHLESA